MSVIKYNGVVLPYAFNTQFRQEAVYDDLGQTDWCYVKFDVECQCIVTSDYLPLMAPDIVGQTTNPAAIMSVIRGRLLEPRKTLTVTFNDTTLIPQNGLQGTVDAKNGPQPQYCIVTQMGDTAFLVSYRVVAYYWEGSTTTLGTNGNPEEQTGNAVLFNRWSETIDIDNCSYTTRTRDGKFVIRSDNQAGKIADMFRPQMAVMGIPKGFLRVSSRYTVSPDGLAIQYSIVDKEAHKMPPYPAFEAEGRYTESTGYGGVQRFCEVWVRLKGNKTGSQPLLISTALSVALKKLAINGSGVGGGNPKAMLESGSVSVDLYRNEVEVRMRAWANPQTTENGKGRAFGSAGIDVNRMAFTPLTGDGQAITPAYTVRGTASLLLTAAAYYDPSVQNAMINQDKNQLNVGLVPGQAGAVPEV